MLVANATLTEISSPATEDDYHGAPAASPTWTGSADCYLQPKTIRTTTPAGAQYVRQWLVYVALDDPPVVVAIGDLLTIQQAQADGSTGTWTVPVMSVEARQQAGMPPDVQTRAFTCEPSSSS